SDPAATTVSTNIDHLSLESNGNDATVTTNYSPKKPFAPHAFVLVERVKSSVRNILDDSIKLQDSEHLFILYDELVLLNQIITAAYSDMFSSRKLIELMNFTKFSTDQILTKLNELKANDCVVLIQSQQFRFNDYHIRLELFKRKIKIIEHVHLDIIKLDEYENYVESLVFSPVKYHDLAYGLKSIVDQCQHIQVVCMDGSECYYEGGMNECKLNIGDYEGMSDVGGTYPIGEVFTEAKDLLKMNGNLTIWSYPSLENTVEVPPQPIKLTIKNGQLEFNPTNNEPQNCTETFNKLLTLIKDGEGDICVRKFGLGLNEGMGKHAIVQDIFAFERQHGMHISLGKKHNVSKAATIKKKETQFHINVFVDVKTITVDDTIIFDNGKYLLENLCEKK
ncbi:unnamed protein product, partial [Didymodactylos carnosus]